MDEYINLCHLMWYQVKIQVVNVVIPQGKQMREFEASYYRKKKTVIHVYRKKNRDTDDSTGEDEEDLEREEKNLNKWCS